MKKEKRQIYIALAEEANTTICSFCRYIESDGGSLCEDDGESCSWCTHPIEAISDMDMVHDITPGDDCWAFNPHIRFIDLVDMVGMVLANGWTRWAWWYEGEKSEKQLYVWGRSEGDSTLS